MGPQVCGTVTTAAGAEATVEIVAGDHDCAFAEDLLDTYYNDPPVLPEGSGGYVAFDGWQCITATFASGGGSSCTRDDGTEIIAQAGNEPEGDAGNDDEPVAFDANGQPITDNFCSYIDEPTLGMLFPDGDRDEESCRSYIAGEVAIDQSKLDGG